MADEHLPSTGADGASTLLAGRYRLGDLIGRGGMAEVYAATDELLHRTVAIKLFRADSLAENERRRIDAEIRTLAGLRHPGLVTVFDAGVLPRAGGTATPFLVMELIHGPTLRRRLADGALARDEAARIGEELATTIGYVHAQGIVHRDVKPANILLDDEAHGPRGHTAKLADFGIARLIEATRLTAVGMTIGTANYLSPEQATGQETGPASDVYSLGLVLLECLTGQVAFPGAGIEAALARLSREPAIPGDLGPEWTRLLAAMTDRDPDRRPPADQVARTLGAIGGPSGRGPSIGGGLGVGGPETGTPTVAVDRTAAAPTVAMNHPADAVAMDRPADAIGSASATRVLAETGRPPDATALLPRRRRPHRPSRARWLKVAAGAVAVLAVVLAVVLVSTGRDGSSGSSSPTSPPSYPTLPGPVGTHLRQLEEAVG